MQYFRNSIQDRYVAENTNSLYGSGPGLAGRGTWIHFQGAFHYPSFGLCPVQSSACIHVQAPDAADALAAFCGNCLFVHVFHVAKFSIF